MVIHTFERTIFLKELQLIIAKLTPGKIINVFRIFASYYVSKIYKKPFIKALPISISIEPTTSCNLRCPECPSGLRQFTRPTGMLDQDFFKKIIAELKNTLVNLTFYFQGEPYLNPKFLDMVKHASENGIFTITSTNAHYLNDENARKTVESKLDKLIISVDGTTQETYEQYRIGGDLNKVIEGTKNIVKWRKELKSKRPLIVFQFLVVKPNEHQINDVYKLAEELGVDDVKLKTAQVYDFENGNSLIPDNEKYSRYAKNVSGKWSIKNKLLNQCWRMWSGCVITWDGLIVPCCFDKDAKHQLGDLKEQSFKKIWLSDGYNNFRRSILKSRKEIDICTNCTEGTKVWA
ncbi:MAG TPA: radical SAM/SPASM domain-containing protein [Bacteroidia bacterium]|jgi:radical SAM protein with 4Fe4S-binding SPASM domain|nr:radical SAM/SPASM domain-containing protein [Bacteroidia bacterium]